MKRKLFNFFTILFMLVNSLGFSGTATAVAAANLDASQFVTSVSVTASNNEAITSAKISDSSSIRAGYSLNLGDGSALDLSQPYTMALPKELNYTTEKPIQLETSDGTIIGAVTISNGLISIQFDSEVKTLTNVTAYFFFSSRFDKTQLDYTNGNDLIFPTQSEPNHTVHINFSKSSGGESSGTSAISKNVRYGTPDATIANWTVVVNRRGDAVADSQYYDVMKNAQFYVPGSMTITYRNWQLHTVRSEPGNPVIVQQADGSQTFKLDFGSLTSATMEDDGAATSVLIHYQTKLLYVPDDSRYPNSASAYDGSQLIDSVNTSATYTGQGGSAAGDQMISIKGNKIWNDDNNAFNSRPSSIKVELLQNGIYIKEQIVTPDAAGNWNYDFTNVPRDDASDNPYVYTVAEQDVPLGYSSSVSGTSITNTYTANELTSVSGVKTWDDNDNIDGLRPASITVQLLANGEAVNGQSKIVTEADNWEYTFTQLPKYDANGQLISYTVSEEAVPGYTTTVDGMNITNTRTPAAPPVTPPTSPADDVISLSGTKTWNDNNNADGLRPDSITVSLLADGKAVLSKEVSAADNWQYTFTQLPRYDANGQLINYSVGEEAVPGYTAAVDGMNITNTRTPTTTAPNEPAVPNNTLPSPPSSTPAPVSPSNPDKKPDKSTMLPSTNDQSTDFLLWLGIVLVLSAIAEIIHKPRKN
ncbi:hypothetical protein OfM1_01420 [Lactovum odontotermitis]